MQNFDFLELDLPGAEVLTDQETENVFASDPYYQGELCRANGFGVYCSTENGPGYCAGTCADCGPRNCY